VAHVFFPGANPIVHEHIIIRAEVRKPPTSVVATKIWFRELIKDIGMELQAGPIVCYLDDPGNRGITSAALIKTSHIAMHVWDEPSPALIQLDVYSCSTLDFQAVLKKLDEFDVVEAKWKTLDRESDLKDLEAGTWSRK
jgi:S-adenosylmethionine/arginine decarboxylase-like enzyme